ncbi:MAG TPA: cytochrome b N-terminal domain-containing protein [Acidimicrobiales bacterium]|nr:cytochrome b N-terminal domain-containing protein [Acidimicrobiales bacterium]
MREVEDGVDITIRVAFALVAMLLAVLLLTGVWLTFNYRPGVSEPLRTAHRLAAFAVVPVGLLVPAAVVVRKRGVGIVVAVAFFAGLVAASFTGYLLPWDQLGLWAVTVGRPMAGVLHPFDETVRFVIIGGAEISTALYCMWVIVHLALLPLVLLATGGFLVQRFLLRP